MSKTSVRHKTLIGGDDGCSATSCASRSSQLWKAIRSSFESLSYSTRSSEISWSNLVSRRSLNPEKNRPCCFLLIVAKWDRRRSSGAKRRHDCRSFTDLQRITVVYFTQAVDAFVNTVCWRIARELVTTQMTVEQLRRQTLSQPQFGKSILEFNDFPRLIKGANSTTGVPVTDRNDESAFAIVLNFCDS